MIEALLTYFEELTKIYERYTVRQNRTMLNRLSEKFDDFSFYFTRLSDNEREQVMGDVLQMALTLQNDWRDLFIEMIAATYDAKRVQAAKHVEEAVKQQYIAIIAPTFDEATFAEMKANVESDVDLFKLVTYCERGGEKERSFAVLVDGLNDERYATEYYSFFALDYALAAGTNATLQAVANAILARGTHAEAVANLLISMMEKYEKQPLLTVLPLFFPVVNDANALMEMYRYVRYQMTEKQWQAVATVMNNHFFAVAPNAFAPFVWQEFRDEHEYARWIVSEHCPETFVLEDVTSKVVLGAYLQRNIHALIQKGQRKFYEEAAKLVADLKQLIGPQQHEKFVADLRRQHARKRSLIEML